MSPMTVAEAAAEERAPEEQQCSKQAMQQQVRLLLRGVGEDVDREGLRDTPKRVAKAFIDMMQGYSTPLESALGTALFNEPIVSKGSGGLVLVRDIDFAATSEETLLPFHGRCHVAYLPAGGVVLGLSKLARLTKLAARRVQTQEALTRRVLGVLCRQLRPAAAAVVIDARHLSYASPAPPRRVTAAAAGAFNGSGADLLAEALAMLGVDEEDLEARGCPLTPLPPLGQGQRQQQLDGSGSSSMRRAPSSSGSDSPLAPVTPDPSERDDDASSASGYVCSAEAEGEEGAASSASVSSAGDAADVAGGMEAAMVALLSKAGVEDVGSPEIQGAVRRYVQSLLASTSGYHQELPLGRVRRQRCTHPKKQQQQQQPAAAVQWCEHHVPFVSQCEHHMLPFYGTVHIAVLPHCSSCGGGDQSSSSDGLLAAEEAAQVVAAYTQRLQVQERITQQVADAVQGLTGSPGVLVAVRAAHMCMVARGVENHAGSTLTRAATGEFEARPDLRARFLRAVAARGDPGSDTGVSPSAAACRCGC